jgi:hypothetical protein
MAANLGKNGGGQPPGTDKAFFAYLCPQIEFAPGYPRKIHAPML